MDVKRRKYRMIFSSDWNECLAPCGPFDFISFTYPRLEPEVSKIFQEYTGNEIAFSEATIRIRAILPGPITQDHMDAYLDARFETYRGVPEFISWCAQKGILFMINTTGVQGYFQRVFAKNLLPAVPVISASPMIHYPIGDTGPAFFNLIEIQDKPKNTEAIMRSFSIGPEKILLMGDSAGDGPHFEWGFQVGAFLIGSMTKWSLNQYCSRRGIGINLRFGPSYSEGEKRNEDREMRVDFMDLAKHMELILAR